MVFLVMFDVPCGLCKTFITKESQEATNGRGGIISVGKMLDADTFWFGISGVFRFIKPLGLKEGDEICNNCLLEQKENIVAEKSVKCTICSDLFQPVWGKDIGEDVDGWGCACTARKKQGKLWLSGGWGSSYDTGRFEVVVPVLKPFDRVCDGCMKVLLEEGSIREDKDYSPF
jgi:hypothetical protein